MLKSVSLATLEKLFSDMEELQRSKVASLALRLKPGLTAEDLRNPHDFPELNDADWHYQDGILTCLQSAVAAVRALHSTSEIPEN